MKTQYMLVSPSARTINYHLACFMLIWQFSTITYYYRQTQWIVTMLNYQTINLPTERENLGITFKHSYPFVTLSIGYIWSVINLKMYINLFLHLRRPFKGSDYHYKYRCMVIFIPRIIWEKQLICFASQNFSCHKTHHLKPKLVLQVEQTT